MKELHER